MFGRLELDGEVIWTDANIDKHAITIYYPNPVFIEGIEIESDEWCIVMGGSVFTIRECDSLMKFLKHKFEK